MPRSKVWFIADTHFGHANIIRFCNRPFESVEEMNETLVSNWNDRVAPMQTLCRECCLKAYGKPGWEGLSAEQVVTGWLFNALL